MKKQIITVSILAGLVFASCQNKPGSQSAAAASKDILAQDTVYQSETLVIRKLSDHTFQHISYLNTRDFGKVGCNGMIVVNDHEAIVFDTPADKESSAELIRYLAETMNYTIKGVVATHFHADCVAGLAEFHEKQVPSYANERTIVSLKNSGDSAAVPQNGFEDVLELSVGDEIVSARFFGQGHTKDNIIAYYPEENVLFGGCLIKELDAGKGNLEDANVSAWSETVRKIKQEYPDVSIVIPGHGKTGGAQLLDYTIQLFDPGA
ncbi:metallo-beta-lactamase class B [Anseongella ginsenosidimutans]|uniref:beta-lactamase n=1 Tax=Anseongella ginsenosidimutans TaxID=496056 RepID=A0A4R3KUY6_9SPHI|nr:subclass B1 metallo-beta-lactamase [Anseongella ginsenosidimutans]QEC51875.1 subclass B1 metallo-beta-lactamase [Anseongella ginsenosidimutans]TCS89259.1 metallo-beta-lactamase class B [Anseongella ginsenosidimutans]